MIKYTDEGLVLGVKDVVAASMFLGKNIGDDSGLLSISDDGDFPFGVRYANGDEAEYWDITIPWPTVKATMETVEGEAYICVRDSEYDHADLILQPYFHKPQIPGWNYYHKRVFNILTTHAELRELVARWEGV